MSTKPTVQAQFLFLISLPNSGDNLLRQALLQSQNFAAWDKSIEARDAHRFSSVQELQRKIANGSKTKTSLETAFTIVDVNYAALRVDRENDSVTTGNGLMDLCSWLVHEQLPVVHLVRENILDCVVGRQIANDRERLTLNPTVVIDEIKQSRVQVDTVRAWLSNANCIEFKYEKLRQPSSQSTRRISELPIHQLCRFLQMEKVLEGNDQPEFGLSIVEDSTASDVSALKLKLRPELTRRGFGNLFDLPKAA